MAFKEQLFQATWSLLYKRYKSRPGLRARMRLRTRRANRWIVHQFYSTSAVIIAVVVFSATVNVCGSLLRRLVHKRQNRNTDFVQRRRPSQDSRCRFVRGIWIWQLVILDDSLDYLSARYARNVGDGFLPVPLRFFPPRFLAGLQTAATPSHLWIISQYDVLCVCHTDALELKSYAWTPTRACYRLTHVTSSITCFFSESRGYTLRIIDFRMHSLSRC